MQRVHADGGTCRPRTCLTACHAKFRVALPVPVAVLLLHHLQFQQLAAHVVGSLDNRGGSAPSAAAAEKLQLVLVDARARDASCLDGSPPGYFLRAQRAGSPNASKWIVHMQGGGWCWDTDERANHGRSCHDRAKTGLGSSRGWNASGTGNPDGSGLHNWCARLAWGPRSMPVLERAPSTARVFIARRDTNYQWQ